MNHTLAYGGTSPGSALLSSAGTLFTPGLAQQDNNGQHFYQTDALGSVRGVSGNNQAPQGEVYYDAFGMPSVRQGSQPSPLGFAGAAGYQTDADTGLMLLGYRYYDPSIGRFLSPDPSGDGDNWYAYCGNDPLTKTDPTGLLANGSEGRRDIGSFTDNLIAQFDYSTSSVWDENAGSKTKPNKKHEPTLWEKIQALAAFNDPFPEFGPKPKSATTPIGRRGNPINVRKGTNKPGVENGRQYTGHAFDQMQGRGITPSMVDETINHGTTSPGRDGATIYSKPGLDVVVLPNGSVKTVITR